MILVDTSVWVDHLRCADPRLVRLLEEAQVATHPFVVGEVALGAIRDRRGVLSGLADLPTAVEATDAEVLEFIAGKSLAGSAIGYVDAHLLASAMLTPHCTLWTRDKRLLAAASALELSAKR